MVLMITSFVKDSLKKLRGSYINRFKRVRLEEEITQTTFHSEPSYESVADIEAQFLNSGEPLLQTTSTDSGINNPSDFIVRKNKKHLKIVKVDVCQSSEDDDLVNEITEEYNEKCSLNNLILSTENFKSSDCGIPETPFYSPVIKVKVKESLIPVPRKIRAFQVKSSSSSLDTEHVQPSIPDTDLEYSHDSLCDIVKSEENELESSDSTLYNNPIYSKTKPFKLKLETPIDGKDLFKKEDLEPLKLIHQTDWHLPEELENIRGDLNKEKKIVENKPVNDKFVINLFESRPSKRWTKKPIKIENNKIVQSDVKPDSLETQIQKLEETFKKLELQNESLNTDSKLEEKYGSTLVKYMNSNEYRNFQELRRERDIECVKMSQVSKALLEMKKTPQIGWCNELVAERLLLAADEKVNLLTNKIRDTYAVLKSAAYHTGTVQMSGLSFPLKNKPKENKHFTDFYIMTVSYDTHMLISNFVMAGETSIDFNHTFTFGNIDSDFELKIKLFSAKLRTSKDIKEKFLEKLSNHMCATSKIIYEDINTRQIQERIVLKPAFKLAAETTLTRDHLSATTSTLKFTELGDGIVDDQAHFNIEVLQVNLEKSEYQGFLTVGRKQNGRINWERKWCVLQPPMLMIYNYPNDQEFQNPCDQINLKYCFGPILSKATSCPRNNTFHLKTGTPSSFMANNFTEEQVLKTKPNFNLEKFYFKGDTFAEYLRWSQEISNILGSLKDWKNLVFSDEYYEYVNKV